MQLMEVVLKQFAVSASSQRLVFIRPAVKAHTGLAVGSTWPLESLGQLYGPGGVADAVFGSWVDQHNGFFGQEHMSACLQVTGGAVC